jgi:hypothetical protein
METRFRLLFAVPMLALMMVQVYRAGSKPELGMQGATQSTLILAVLFSMVFAGAGIATQPAFQESKGLHESTFFTLSLPVSRFRLLVVRAGLGWLEMACVIALMCSLLWALFPERWGQLPPEAFLRLAVVLTACATGLYFMNVLLVTFLEHPWLVPASGTATGALWLLFNQTPLPASVNIFHAMAQGSPLFAHTMPWPAMAFSLALGGILFLAALKVVQSREY